MDTKYWIGCIFALVLGVGLLLNGLYAFFAGKVTASSDLDDDQNFEGMSARVIALVWILVSLPLLFGGLGTLLGCASAKRCLGVVLDLLS